MKKVGSLDPVKLLADLAETLGEGTAKLAPVLYARCRAKPEATRSEASWNQSVLDFVTWGLSLDISLPAMYDVLAETLATKVSAIGRDAGLGAEELQELRDSADNTVSQLNGPFWHVAYVLETDGADSFAAVVADQATSWSAVKRFVTDRVADIAFAPERFAVACSYTPRGTDHSVTFTVEQAAKKRDAYEAARSKADSIKEDWAPNWRAVLRQIRSENPCGMLDKRTKADREAVDVRAGAHLLTLLTDTERDALRQKVRF